jgi:hypothetical protein
MEGLKSLKWYNAADVFWSDPYKSTPPYKYAA